jgi:hypothetical protein
MTKEAFPAELKAALETLVKAVAQRHGFGLHVQNVLYEELFAGLESIQTDPDLDSAALTKSVYTKLRQRLTD